MSAEVRGESGASGAELPSTEDANPGSSGLDRLDALGIVRLFQADDRRAWEALDAAEAELAALVEWTVAAFRNGGRLLWVGAGTSGRLGVLDASECPPTFGVEPERVVGIIAGGDRALRDAVEGAEDDRDEGARAIAAAAVEARDVVCGIAASGRTPFVHGALGEARRRGASTALIACDGRLERERDAPDAGLLIRLDVGPEVLAGSTRLKAGTATKLALNRVTTGAMVLWGKVYDNLMVDVRPTNAKLRRRARRLVERIGRVDSHAALARLEEAGWEVKTAIVMARTGQGVAEARAALDRHGGFLRAALGE